MLKPIRQRLVDLEGPLAQRRQADGITVPIQSNDPRIGHERQMLVMEAEPGPGRIAVDGGRQLVETT